MHKGTVKSVVEIRKKICKKDRNKKIMKKITKVDKMHKNTVVKKSIIKIKRQSGCKKK